MGFEVFDTIMTGISVFISLGLLTVIGAALSYVAGYFLCDNFIKLENEFYKMVLETGIGFLALCFVLAVFYFIGSFVKQL